jgi:hypothetical protein
MPMNVMGVAEKSLARSGQLRSKAPVFVLGCPRSGTTLLYYMLLSSGNFAVYREESGVFNYLMPHFGDLRQMRNRQKLLKFWFTTKLFTKTGLHPEQVEQRVLTECRTAGDFLRIGMEEIARSQGVERWAESTNENLVILPLIKAMIPDALIIHMIRDGRDAALSLDKMGWMRRYPWNPECGLMVCGLYWEWMVRQGREGSSRLGSDYLEVRFENLVANPREALAEVSRLIGQNLDYDKIRAAGMRRLSVPNTSFEEELCQSGFNPVGRWKKMCTSEQLATLEGLIGKTLTESGYLLGTPAEKLDESLDVRKMRLLYPRVFALKKWVKFYTPFRRLFPKFPEVLLEKQSMASRSCGVARVEESGGCGSLTDSG